MQKLCNDKEKLLGILSINSRLSCLKKKKKLTKNLKANMHEGRANAL